MPLSSIFPCAATYDGLLYIWQSILCHHFVIWDLSVLERVQTRSECKDKLCYSINLEVFHQLALNGGTEANV